jgi:hypothetical protein
MAIRWKLVGRAAVLACLSPVPAHAQERVPVTLEWRAPEDCPSSDAVRAEVARLLGSSRREASVQATADVSQPAPGRWSVAIQLEGSVQGSRSLSAASCESLGRATALIIALAIDPEAVSSVQEAAPPPPAPPPSKPKPEPEPRPPPRQAARLGGLLTSGVVVEQALVPHVAMGGFLGAGVSARWLRVELVLGLVPTSSAPVDGPADARVDFTLGTLDLRGCPRLLSGSLQVLGCMGLRAHLIRARASGVTASQTRTTTLLGATAGLLASWSLHRAWALELGVDAVVPLARPYFDIENLGTAYRPAAIGAAGSMGLAARF